jgi:nicotinamide-nucleotide amidase
MGVSFERSVSLLTIGDEILIGQIENSNAVWLAREMNKIGLSVVEMLSVGDRRTDIMEALGRCCLKSATVIITGGLGPTPDDLTKECLAAYFGGGMELDSQTDLHLADFFANNGRNYSDINRTQAILPVACRPLTNHWGTAPGMLFETERHSVFSLPGVPNEMKNIMQNEGIGFLSLKYQLAPQYHKTYSTEGIPESELMRILSPWEKSLPDEIKLAYLPSAGQVRLRISTDNASNDALTRVAPYEKSLYNIIGHEIYGTENETLGHAILTLFREQGLTLSTAESCTGGLLSSMLTSTPGISSVLLGGVVSYDNSVKINRLGVNPSHFHTVGAVSEEVVIEMAEGVRRFTGSDYAIATSGIAGPDGGTQEKPVGMVWIAWAGPEQTHTRCFRFAGDRHGIMLRASLASLNLLRKIVAELPISSSFWDFKPS